MFIKPEIIVIVSCGRIEKICSKNNLPVRVVLANHDAEDAEGVIVTDKDGNAIGLSDMEVEYDSRLAAQLSRRIQSRAKRKPKAMQIMA